MERQWTLHIHDELPSTFDLAATVPPWSAIVARRQTRGRGRLGRSFVCDTGGLWLSAVLPAAPPPSRWQGFSLAVGEALLDALESLGVSARLRWPNDIMVGSRKLSGILIEQRGPHENGESRDTAICVGLGMNVSNEPWNADPALRETACRLADFLPTATVESALPPILAALAAAHERFERDGLESIIATLNKKWQPRRVTLALYGERDVSGIFQGLDANGDLLLKNDVGNIFTVPHQNIQRLVERP